MTYTMTSGSSRFAALFLLVIATMTTNMAQALPASSSSDSDGAAPAPSSGGANGSSNCPFHPCTPALLGCSQLLRNELGCLLCRCENSTQSDRPCQLHGCTVKLLQCSGSRLKKSPQGCNLCECEDEGAATIQNVTISGNRPMTLPLVPIDDDEAGSLNGGGQGVPLTRAPPTFERRPCPALDCTAEELGCQRLVTNPLTGCTECRCVYGNAPSISGVHLTAGNEGTDGGPQPPVGALPGGDGGSTLNPCPEPREILNGAQMRRGTNGVGKKKLTYKLVLGKLKRGFEPGKSYRISLKGRKKGKKFRAFLFTVRPAPNVRPESAAPSTSGAECSAGLLSDFRKRRKKRGAPGLMSSSSSSSSAGRNHRNAAKHVRPIPRCPTQAIEADERTNKTVAHANWTAPLCGCVYISVAVVDETNTVGYLDDVFLSDEPLTTKVNRPLIKTVCAKRSSGNQPAKAIKPERGNEFIRHRCCYQAYKNNKRGLGAGKKGGGGGGGNKRMKAGKLGEKCANEALTYTGKQNFRYEVFRQICIRSYSDCCRYSPHVPNDDHRRGGGRTEPNGGGEGRRRGQEGRRKGGKRARGGGRKSKSNKKQQ